MLFFFGYTLYAGYLGWQYRRIRTIGDEISALKKTMPAAVEGEPVSPLGQQIAALTEVWHRMHGALQWTWYAVWKRLWRTSHSGIRSS